MYKVDCPHCGAKTRFYHYDYTWVTHDLKCDKCSKHFRIKIKAMEVTECAYVDKDYGAISK